MNSHYDTMKNISTRIESLSGILELSFYIPVVRLDSFEAGLFVFLVSFQGQISLSRTRRSQLQINLSLLSHRWVFLRWQAGRLLRRNSSPGRGSNWESVLALDSEPEPESESQLVPPIEKLSPSVSSARGEAFSWDFSEGHLQGSTTPPFLVGYYYHGEKFSLVVSLDLLPRGR